MVGVRRLPKPSPATVISLIALFVALTGSGTAATLVLTKHEGGARANATDAKVGRAVPTARCCRGRRGPRGPRGLRGPVGPVGPQGVQGPPGPAGGFDPSKVVTRIGENTTVVAGSGENKLEVACAQGEAAIGGGYASSVGFATVSGPTANNAGWTATIDATNNSVSGIGYAIAVCAHA